MVLNAGHITEERAVEILRQARLNADWRKTRRRYVGAHSYELLDAEVGRLVRLLPRFETSILLLTTFVRPDKTWLELSLARTSELITMLEDAIWDFPDQDRSFVDMYLGDAAKFWS